MWSLASLLFPWEEHAWAGPLVPGGGWEIHGAELPQGSCPSPAQPRTEPPSQPRDAGTKPVKMGRSAYPTFTWTADAGARVGSACCFKPLNFEMVCPPATAMRSCPLRLLWWLREQLDTNAHHKCKIVGSEHKGEAVDQALDLEPEDLSLSPPRPPIHSVNLGR